MEFPIFNPNLAPLRLKKVKSNFEYFINVLNRLETIKKIKNGGILQTRENKTKTNLLLFFYGYHKNAIKMRLI